MLGADRYREGEKTYFDVQERDEMPICVEEVFILPKRWEVVRRTVW